MRKLIMKNSRGAALLQVLMLSALLAGLSVMVLRATLSRQVTARQTRHAVGAEAAVEACNAEIQNMWAVMNPETYKNQLSSCLMPTQQAMPAACGEIDPPTDHKTWYCGVNPYNSATKSYCVKAVIATREGGASSPCQISFAVEDGVNL